MRKLLHFASQAAVKIGPIATPDAIQWAPALPKNRAGKILRRILTKIANNDLRDFGDTSTLADASIVEDIVRRRQAELAETAKENA